MADLKELKLKKKYSPSQLIDSLAENKEEFDYCIFLAVKKDGSQYLRTSEINHEEKCFLTMFLNKVALKFFDFVEWDQNG